MLGHRLVDTYMMSFHNDATNADSGPVAAMIYSLKPADFGADNDDEIVINVADAASGWGKNYAASMSRSTPNDDGTVPTRIAPNAVLLNPGQLVVRLGSSVVNVTSSEALNAGDAAKLIAALKSQ